MGLIYNEANLWHIEFSLLSFKKYINLVEDKFQNEVTSIRERFNEIQKEIDENKKNYEPAYQIYLTDSAIEEMIEIEVEFLQRFRNSVIVQIFSFLETELKVFCNSHAKVFKKEFNIDDLKGNNELDKAKKYLKKAANIDITTNQENWKFIDNIRKLRNKIVHQNSTITSNDNDYNAIFEFSKNKFILKKMGLKNVEIILNDKKFLENCLEQINIFFKHLSQ